MRGKDDFDNVLDMDTRITPAYAGKRSGSGCRAYESQDHPCVCGEKGFISSICSVDLGSPLRMRGKASLLHL